LERLFPEPGPTSVSEQLDSYRPWDDPPAERPHVALNFATTLDGRASIEGRSGPIGSDVDTAMLVGLRRRFDAVMIGAGTMREERYGRIVNGPDERSRRLAEGLPPDPVVAIVGSLDLPWDADLFTDAEAQVVLFTGAEEDPPATAAPVEVVRAPDGRVDVASALTHMRREHDVRALLCEGGPHLHSELQAAGLADELFLTIAPKLVGAGATILEGALPEVAELDLVWLLQERSELFARYRRR
jgi:riboflavin biosynthesis pyrimidine reductase